MPAPTTPPTPDTVPPVTAPPAPTETGAPPYVAGEHVQVLYMTDSVTVLADGHVVAVSPHGRGQWTVTAILSEPRTAFALRPDATHAVLVATDPRITLGTDHTRRSA